MKFNILLLLTVFSLITLASASPYSSSTGVSPYSSNINQDIPINYSLIPTVNNSLYWNGYEYSDTRWLEIDGANANQDIDIGDYDFRSEDIIADGNLEVDDGIKSTNNIEIWGSYFLKWLDNGGANTYAYIMASITEFKIASVSETDMNFYYGNLGSHLGASMDGATGDWNFTQDVNIEGDSTLSDTFPITTLTYSLGSGALRWLNLYVQNINAEEIDAYNLHLSENLTVDGDITTGLINGINISNISNEYLPLSGGTMQGDLNVTGTIINDAIYCESSELNDQVFASAGVRYRLNISNNDEGNGISMSTGNNGTNITIDTSGVYHIVAQPQVKAGPSSAGDFHMWIEKFNYTAWVDIPDSNIELKLASLEEDVIVLATTLKLNQSEKLRLVVSVSDNGILLHAQSPAGEPIIPSIIFTMYRVGS